MSPLRRTWLFLMLTLALAPGVAESAGDPRLRVVGLAPAFALDSSRGARVALADLRREVLAVTLIFTTCTESCPILTAKLAEVGPAMQR